MSRQLAVELGDRQYFAAAGSLSDYEAVDTPPRHIHKLITLCAVYGLYFSTILKGMGVRPEEASRPPIPDHLVPRESPTGPARAGQQEPTEGFLEELLQRSGDVPFFLRGCVPGLSGLRSPSMNDLFWVGGDRNPLHPLLAGGLIVIVNRHRKKALHFRSRPMWQQPVYVVLKRDGTYLCGCCSLESGTLILHPYSANHPRAEQLRNHEDAEVVGQIVTIARKL